MFHFDHLSWRIVADFGLFIVLIFGITRWISLRSRRANPLRIWQCTRYQGGANVYTPHPMTEEDAIEFCSKLGSILWVDREHGFIFYRPSGGA